MKNYNNEFDIKNKELLISLDSIDSTFSKEIQNQINGINKLPVNNDNMYNILIRKPENEISMKEQMIDIENFDIGKNKAIIIKDPDNKKNIKGFLRIPVTVWGTELKPAENGQKAVILFVDGMKYHCKINLKTENRIFLENPIIYNYPFIYISSETPFNFTETEKKNLRNYVENGGFVFADAYNSLSLNTLQQIILYSLGSNVRVSPVRPDQPLYRAYYTFIFPDEIANPNMPDELLNYRLILKGVWFGERLVGIISNVGYGSMLDSGIDLPGKQRFSFDIEEMRLLVNCIVFSLIREESVAVKYIEYQLLLITIICSDNIPEGSS